MAPALPIETNLALAWHLTAKVWAAEMAVRTFEERGIMLDLKTAGEVLSQILEPFMIESFTLDLHDRRAIRLPVNEAEELRQSLQEKTLTLPSHVRRILDRLQAAAEDDAAFLALFLDMDRIWRDAA